MPGEDMTWPDGHAWESLKSSDLAETAVKEVLDLTGKGIRVRPGAFFNMVENIQSYFSDAEERLLGLLEIINNCEWDNGQYRAMILDKFIDIVFVGRQAYNTFPPDIRVYIKLCLHKRGQILFQLGQ